MVVAMISRLLGAIWRAARGTAGAVRGRPWVFAGAFTGVFLLQVFIPPLFLSLVRKPMDFYTFNPWLARLPSYLTSAEIPLQKKLESLPKLALFWFSADSAFGTEWGFAVDVTDLVRILLMSILVGAYFALLSPRAGPPRRGSGPVGVGHNAGLVGALGSVVGISTGPCSVMGCGAPVIPVVGLAFAGLSSGTLALLATASRISTAVILLGMTSGVAYLGWLAGPDPGGREPRPS
jgi:hypothetical protein